MFRVVIHSFFVFFYGLAVKHPIYCTTHVQGDHWEGVVRLARRTDEFFALEMSVLGVAFSNAIEVLLS